MIRKEFDYEPRDRDYLASLGTDTPSFLRSLFKFIKLSEGVKFIATVRDDQRERIYRNAAKNLDGKLEVVQVD